MQNKPKAPKRFVFLITQLVNRYFSHDVGRDSAALTYYLLFAIFPLLIFVSTLLGVLRLDIESTSAFLLEFIPADVVDVVRSYLAYVSENASRQLMWFSLVFSIWFPMRAASCLMHSVRKAMGRGRPKNAVIGTLRNLIITAWLIVVIVVSLVLTTVGRRALAFVSGLVTLPAGFVNLWSSLRFVLLGVAVFSLLVPLYMLAQGERRPLREIVPGVAASLAVWMLLSFAFSYYVEHLARYTQLYGAIAAIVVVLLWLYMSGTIMIMGAEFNGAILQWKNRDGPSGDREDQT